MEATFPGTYLLVLGRIITILPFALVVTLLIMGKRPIGELPVFDFLVIVIIGALVGADIADPSVPHLPTGLAIIAVAGLQWAVSRARVRWRRFDRWAGFEPTVIVHKGHFVQETMKRLNYTLDDALFQLREQGHFDPSKVELALVEPSGKLSVLVKAEHAPATRKDLGLQGLQKNVPLQLVIDGKVLEENLALSGMNHLDLSEALKKRRLSAIDQTFFAYLDSSGDLQATPYGTPEQVTGKKPPRIVH